MASTRNLRPRRAVSKSEDRPLPPAESFPGSGHRHGHIAVHAIDPSQPYQMQDEKVMTSEQWRPTNVQQPELNVGVDVEVGLDIAKQVKKRPSQKQPRKTIAKKPTTKKTTMTTKKPLLPATKGEHSAAMASSSKTISASSVLPPHAHPHLPSSPTTPSLPPSLSSEAYKAHMTAVLAGHESELFALLDQAHENAVAADTSYLSQFATVRLPSPSQSKAKSTSDPQPASSATAATATHLRLAHAASLQRMARLYELYTHVNGVIRETRPNRSTSDRNFLTANHVHGRRSDSEELPRDVQLVRSFLQTGMGDAQAKLRAVVATTCRQQE